jgi:hypothetical protein
LRTPVSRDNGELAFHDTGNKLYTHKTDADIAVAMTKMAEAKGWSSVKVDGHSDFRREVWMEASLQGIAVNGFTPSDKDLATLEARRQKAKEASGQLVPEVASAAAKAEKNLKVLEGTLLENGMAPYQHDKKNQPSYYVRVRDDVGRERTVWGVDPKRAMDKAGALPGDRVRLENEGNKMVSVKTAIRDKDGKITGHKEKEVKRNAWSAEKTQGQKITEALAKSVILKNGLVLESPAAKQFLEAVSKEAAKREADGKLPKIPIRDVKAVPKKREADMTQTRSRRGVARKEKDICKEQTQTR